jgi:hypothetical protein
VPTNIRAILSVVVVLVTAAAFYFERESGSGAHWLALCLGVFMTAAVWLFPEARKTKVKGR